MWLTYSPLLRLFIVWSLLCHMIWPFQDFFPPLFRLLMIIFSSNPLVLMLLRLPLQNLIHRWPSMLTNIVVIFLYMYVISFICQLSISHWHASYLVSSLHIGLDLFPSIALFLGLHIILTCQKSMGCIHPVFHVSYLHPHIGPVPPCPPSPLPLDDNTAGEFKVEDILDSHLGCYGTEYLV